MIAERHGNLLPHQYSTTETALKAITATAHQLVRIVYRLMRFGEAYVNQTEEAYAEQVRERREKQLHRRARELGYEVVRRQAEPQGRASEAAKG